MKDIVLAGNTEDFQLGGHFVEAASQLGLTTHTIRTDSVASKWRLLDRISYRFNRRRPLRMQWYQQQLNEACENESPRYFIATGMIPVLAKTLQTIGEMGIPRINYLTDDPWNPAHRTAWRLASIAEYDTVFTPRHSNRDQLAAIGVKNVHYLPFGYSKRRHAVDSIIELETNCDVMFVGSADADRLPIVRNLIRHGLKLRLYGAYWEQDPVTRKFAEGVASISDLREAVQRAAVTLVLVRRGNRDGHVMRTFESAASGGCLLVEDTEEHQAIFGNDGSVAYFHDSLSLVSAAKLLVGDVSLRQQMRHRVHEKIVLDEHHTYECRLSEMLKLVDQNAINPDKLVEEPRFN